MRGAFRKRGSNLLKNAINPLIFFISKMEITFSDQGQVDANMINESYETKKLIFEIVDIGM